MLGHASASYRDPSVCEFDFWFQLNKTRGGKRRMDLELGGREKEGTELCCTWEVLGREGGLGRQGPLWRPHRP